MKANKVMLDLESGEVTEVPTEVVDKNWYRRPANYQLGQFDKDIETKREPSLTVPSMAFTVREILEKFTRGLPMDIKQEGIYENPEDFSENDPERALDITDVEEQLTEVNSRIAEAKARKASEKGEVLGGENKAPDITEAKKADKTEEEV